MADARVLDHTLAAGERRLLEELARRLGAELLRRERRFALDVEAEGIRL